MLMIVLSYQGPRRIQIDFTIHKTYFNITDEGNIETYLGTQIDHEPGFMRMSQPNLINRIIEAIPGMDKANPKSILMPSNKILTKDENGKERQEAWNYRSIIGMLNYLVNTTFQNQHTRYTNTQDSVMNPNIIMSKL